MPVSNIKLYLTTQELTAPGAPGCLLCGLYVELTTLVLEPLLELLTLCGFYVELSTLLLEPLLE
jgi:hypothetical protein